MESRNETVTVVDDYAELQKYIKDVEDRNCLKSKLIQINQSVTTSSRPDEAFFRNLDSSMKKTRAFVRKLKSLTSSTCPSMKKEFDGLNLSQYTGELAAALCESKRKMDDVPSAVELCTLINVRYEDFSSQLYEVMSKALISRKDSKIVNPTLYRVNLRFFAELVSVGVLSEKGLSFLSSQLNLITATDLETFSNLAIISAFTKFCGLDYAGVHHHSARLTAEKYDTTLPPSLIYPSMKNKCFHALLVSYFQQFMKFTARKHAELCNNRRQNNQILQTRGELSDERIEKSQALLDYFENLVESARYFANFLDKEFTEFVDPNEKTKENEGSSDQNGVNSDDVETTALNSQWYIDDDMRAFYYDIPDITKLNSGNQSATQNTNKIDSKSQSNDDELSSICESFDIKLTEEVDEIKQLAPEIQEALDTSICEETKQNEEEVETSTTEVKSSLADFIVTLKSSLNKEMIDKAAEEFYLTLNTRINRKKLARAIFNVNRTRYDLLPLYARLVKILFPVMTDLAAELAEHLKKDFLWQLKVKNQINIESKLRTVRLIAELTKFEILPITVSLNCLKVLIHDFSYHNIEMTCAILDSCGRYLYCNPDAHQRIKVYMDWITQKKMHLHLDSRYVVMIENAYYSTKPLESLSNKPVETIPIHFQYVHFLLQSDFTIEVEKMVVGKLCKYNWEDEKTFDFLVSCFVEVWRYKFNELNHIAAIVSNIAKSQISPRFYVVVADRVFEGIKLCLESMNPSWKQRAMAMVRLVGELNFYNLVDCEAVCGMLYSLLQFGYGDNYLNESVTSNDEMKDCLFRIRLVCVLLDTLFSQFSSRNQLLSYYGRRLDYFVIIFRLYFWFKYTDKIWDEDNIFPPEIYALYMDSADCPLVDLPSCESVEDARKLYDKLLKIIFNNKMTNSGLMGEIGAFSQPKEIKSANKIKAERLLEIEKKRKEIIRIEDDKNDSDFMKMFDKMVSESTVPRQLERVKMPVSEMMKTPIKMNGCMSRDLSAVECRLLSRKGKKQQQLSLMVDKSTTLGTRFATQQSESKEEDNLLKNMVLKMHKRQQLEDMCAENVESDCRGENSHYRKK